VTPDPKGSAANPAQLRGDIDEGKTGDKVPGFDPAAAPLGTDDEAGGATTPPGLAADERRQAASQGQAVERPNAAAPELAPVGGGVRPRPLGLLVGVGIAVVLVALAVVFVL
jgi:hypothetical protein